jgi:hypothetical protein
MLSICIKCHHKLNLKSICTAAQELKPRLKRRPSSSIMRMTNENTVAIFSDKRLSRISRSIINHEYFTKSCSHDAIDYSRDSTCFIISTQ